MLSSNKDFDSGYNVPRTDSLKTMKVYHRFSYCVATISELIMVTNRKIKCFINQTPELLNELLDCQVDIFVSLAALIV